MRTSTRFSAALLTKLQEAAKRNRRTLSEEITERLDRSFHESIPVEVFGGDHTHAFLALVARALKKLRADTGQCWHRDRFTFEEAVKAVAEIFSYFRRPGRPTVPQDMPVLEKLRASGLKVSEVKRQAQAYPFGKLAARLAVFELETASEPGEEPSTHQKVIQRIAFELRPQLAASGRSAQRDLTTWK